MKHITQWTPGFFRWFGKPTSTPHPCEATHTLWNNQYTLTHTRSRDQPHTHTCWISTTHKNNHKTLCSTHESTLTHPVLDKEISTTALYAQTNNTQTQGSKELIEVSPLTDVDLAAATKAIQVLLNGAHEWRGWRTLALTLWVRLEVASIS